MPEGGWLRGCQLVAGVVGLRPRPPRVLGDALAKETDSGARRQLAVGLSAVAVRLDPAEGARVLGDALAKETDSDAQKKLGQGIKSVLLGVRSDSLERARDATLLAAGTFATPCNLIPSLALLHPHFQPRPRPLPPQELVELLKHPLFVGAARRAVLDALEVTYRRPFKDQWEFVEYAQKHQPQLDLLTPPKRPQP